MSHATSSGFLGPHFKDGQTIPVLHFYPEVLSQLLGIDHLNEYSGRAFGRIGIALTHGGERKRADGQRSSRQHSHSAAEYCRAQHYGSVPEIDPSSGHIQTGRNYRGSEANSLA
jgi:hypothetical protein